MEELEDHAAYGDIILKNDPDLLKDIINCRESDMPALVKRLNASVSSLKDIFASSEISSSDVLKYAKCLGHCYGIHIDTKLQKPLEKVLLGLPAPLLSVVKQDLECYMKKLLLHRSNTRQLSQLSVFLEQPITTDVIDNMIPDLCDFLRTQIDELLSSSFEEFTQDNSSRSAIIIKISLQLFQHHGNSVKNIVWMETPSSSRINKRSVKTVVQMLLITLTENCFGLDVQLLAGTALTMLLNTAPDPVLSVTSFWTIYQALIEGNTWKISIGQLNIAYHSTRKEHSVKNLFGKLAFIRGQIVCGLEDILCCEIVMGPRGDSQIKTQQDNTLIFQLFPIVLTFCDGPLDIHYQGFQLLCDWFRCLLRMNLQIKQNYKAQINNNSHIVKETLKRIWLNWDSPVDGVAHYTSETFSLMMKIWSREVKAGISDNTTFAKNLLKMLLEVPWYTKGKYRLLCILLPYEDSEKILTLLPQIKDHLLLCMKLNSLAPVAADVYRTFLYQLKNDTDDKEKQITKWKPQWMDTILIGLLSEDVVLSRKISEYWVKWTVKLLSGCGLMLNKELQIQFMSCRCPSKKTRLLYAWAVVTRIIRCNQCLSFEDINIKFLRTALYADNEDVRSEAVGVICGTLKTSECLSHLEIDLLKAVLPHCLKTDSAPFRQQLATNIRLLVTRIRESCVTNLKKNVKLDVVDESLEFLMWLNNMLIENTTPGVNYQRRKACLEMLLVIYETTIYSPNETRKKGYVDESVNLLTEYAKRKELWNIFSTSSLYSILHCVLDGADEIQELALHILMKYYPWPIRADFPLGNISEEMLASYLLVKALILCNSPRPYESQSGALLCKLVLVKYVKDHGTVFSKCCDVENSLTFTQKQEKPESAVVKFIKLLTCEVSEHLNTARYHPKFAAKQYPIHGLMQAITKCLEEINMVISRDVEQCEEVLMEIISVNMKIIDLMLSVLSGGINSDICPSFAEMGTALENLTDEDDVESATLSPEFQFLLSWCWVNLKTSCTCLGEVVGRSSLMGLRLEAEMIASIGQTFVRVLTHCRHRGAIEGCRSGLLKYCITLLSSTDKNISCIPAKMLQEVLSSLENNRMSSSVTRRSAGLPIIIQTVTKAEKQVKQQKLLIQAINTVLKVASMPVQTETDQTQDISQVHALNILKVLFGDASLVTGLLSYFSRIVVLVISCFESPSWAVRNAATQLFSTMINRIFGQKNKSECGQNRMTLNEFDSYYPELLPFVQQIFDETLTDIDSIEKLHPSLFLVMTLLANMGPTDSKENSSRFEFEFKKRILIAAQSPVYVLRELTAKAFCAVVPIDSITQAMQDLIQQIPISQKELKSSNHLHTNLLCIEKLLKSHTLSEDKLKDFLTAFLKRRWVMECSKSLLLSAKYIQIVRIVLHSLPMSDELIAELSKLFKSAFIYLKHFTKKFQIGENAMAEELVQTTFVLMVKSPAELSQCCKEYLSSNLGFQIVCLTCLLKLCVTNQHLFDSLMQNLQEVIWLLVREEVSISVILTALSVITEQGLRNTETLKCPLSQNDFYYLEKAFSKRSSIIAALLPARSVWVRNIVTYPETAYNDSLLLPINEWCEKIKWAAGSHQNENLRLASAQALVICGSDLLQFCHTSQLSKITVSIVSLLDAAVTLLEDVDTSIRKMTAKFVSKLQWPGQEIQFDDLNCSISLEILFKYAADTFWWSEAFIEYLLQKLYKNGDLRNSLEKRLNSGLTHLFEQTDSSFYAETLIRNTEIYNTLKRILDINKLESQHFDKKDVDDLHEELKKCISVIDEDTKANPLINLTGEPSVIEAFSGALMKAGIIVLYGEVKPSQVQSLGTERIKDLISHLCQLKNMHPWIYKVVQTIK